MTGSLDTSGVRSDRPNGVIRIIGEAYNTELTLDDCFLIASRDNGYVIYERYYARTILSGATFSDSEPLEFGSAILFLQHLREWCGRCYISNDRPPLSKEEGTITYTRPPPVSAPTEFGELAMELWSNFAFDSDRFKICAEQIYGFTIRCYEPQSLTTIVRLSSALQDLLTICVNRTAAITGFSLHHSAHNLESASGEIRDPPIELHVQHRGNHALTNKAGVQSHEILITFAELGGIDGIGKWLTCAAQDQGTLSTLLSHHYIPRMYADNRFGNIVTAAEALKRVRSGKQKNINLNRALGELADEAGEPFRVLVQDVDRWVKRVVKTRNNHVVHRGLHENEAPDLYALSESVYFLVIMCLLRECDVDIKASQNIERNQVFAWLSRELQRDP